MSSDRVIKEIYLDTEGMQIRAFQNNTFSSLSTTTTLFRGTQILFRCNLRMADATTAFVPPAGASWLFGIDDGYTADHADLVLSSVFNQAGDWDYNLSNGKITWRTDLTSAALKTSLGDSASKLMYAYLWMTPVGGSPTLLAQWDVIIKNIAVDPTTATPVEGISFMTTDAATASFVPVWGDQSRWRWKSGGWQYMFEADSKWRSMVGKMESGQPVLAWGDPED